MIYLCIALVMLIIPRCEAAQQYVAHSFFQQPDCTIAEYLFFDNGDDSTGNGHNGVTSNGATYSLAYLDIAAGNQSFVVADSADLTPNDISVEFWLSTTSKYNDVRMISKEGSTTDRSWYVACYMSAIRLLTSSDGSALSVYSTPSVDVWDGEWHHIAATHESGVEDKIYIDGKEVIGTRVTGVLQGNLNDNLAYMAVGKDARGVQGQPGKYSKVIISSRAKSPEEILESYLEGP